MCCHLTVAARIKQINISSMWEFNFPVRHAALYNVSVCVYVTKNSVITCSFVARTAMIF